MNRDLAELVARLRTGADFPIEFADESKPGWLSRALGQGMALLNADDADVELKEARDRALVTLDGLSDELEGLGRQGVANLLRRLYSDDARGALSAWRYYLDEGRTYEERRALQRQATMAAIEEVERRRAAWDSFCETVREIGASTLKLIIPAILAGL